eukprot:41542_1
MSLWWKERGKRPKTGPKYEATIPDLLSHESKQNPQFHDCPILMDYFEVQHFYQSYQDDFDYNAFVKKKRNQYQIYLHRQRQEADRLIAQESKFRRSNRFKNNPSQNYKEVSPQTNQSESDDFTFEDSSEHDIEDIDQEYVVPIRRKGTNKTVSGRKRRYGDITDPHAPEQANKKRKMNPQTSRILSKSVTKKRKTKVKSLSYGVQFAAQDAKRGKTIADVIVIE